MNAQKEPELDWASLRTAYHVARLGTLSAAAAYLGVHHATVIRHIDSLEAQLHCKLFQRQPRGYRPTEVGETLFQVVAAADEQFLSVAKIIKGQSETVSGDLTITSLAPLAQWITPLVAEFQHIYPDIRVSLNLDERLLRLDLGEAHIAVRSGPKPAELDYIVRSVGKLKVAMYASKLYIEQYGDLSVDQNYKAHRFVGATGQLLHTPIYRWLENRVPSKNVVFRSSELFSLENAVRSGAGIGFLTVKNFKDDKDLVMVKESKSEWDTDLWLVTHRDLNRIAKVNTLAQFLVDRMKSDLL